MHASLEQLIALRDGEPLDAAVRSHVQACARCRAQIDNLAGMRARISALPVFNVPEQSWSVILQRMQKTGKPGIRLRRRLTGLALAAAASVIIAIGIWTLQKPRHPQAESLTTSIMLAARVPQLVSQSRSLENTVLSLNASADHLVISAGTAATVAALEDRIALVDYQINSASARRGESPELAQLWQQRVDLLQSLAAVRYAQLASNGI